MFEMHREQLRMSLLIESGSGVPEEVMFPLKPEEGLGEPSKSTGWGTDRRADGQGRAPGKRVVSQGPMSRAKALGVGWGEVRSFKEAGGGRGRWQGCDAALGSWGLPRGHSRATEGFF